MHLYYYKYKPNFGDALNQFIWPKLIKVDLSQGVDCGEVFVGIGTLLNKTLPTARLLHIFGSGAGYGEILPYQINSWKIHFVRGPLTAKKLGVPLTLAISDPAILLHNLADTNIQKKYRCSFMPHHEIDSQRYRELCESIGINYISPLADCEGIITAISESNHLVCSAMHGAIAAEALRVPWLPVLTDSGILTSKWNDWAESLQLNIRFENLPSIWPSVRDRLDHNIISSIKEMFVKKKLLRLSCSNRFILGSDKILEDRLKKIQEKINFFNSAYSKL